MVVLRVQDGEGRGPYRPGFSARWSDPNGPICKPWWIEIGETFEVAHQRFCEGYHWGCGFQDIDRLRSWFTARELKALDRLGFCLVTVEPDIIVAETPSQIVFGTLLPLADARPRMRLVSKLARAA